MSATPGIPYRTHSSLWVPVSGASIDPTAAPGGDEDLVWEGIVPAVGGSFDSTAWPHQSEAAAGRVSSVLDPKDSGLPVMRFAITDSDVPSGDDSDASRADYESPPMFGPTNDPDNGEYNDIYFTMDWLADANLASPNIGASGAGSSAWYGFVELYGKPYGGSPIISFGLNGYWTTHNQVVYSFLNSSGQLQVPWICPDALDTEWHKYGFHVHWSTDDSVGFVELYYEGEKQAFSTAHAANAGITNGDTKMFLDTLRSGLNWNGTDTSTNWNFVNIMSYRSSGVWAETITTYCRNMKVGLTEDTVTG